MRASTLAVALVLGACVAEGHAPDGSPAAGEAAPFANCRFGPVSPLRIAPIGDSITQATNGRLSYRYFLWERLLATGVEFDFIGTQFQHFGGSRSYPDGRFDRDHEGHWGESAVEFNERFPSRPWPVPADVALIHLGTNDTASFSEPPPDAERLDEAAEALEGIIAQLRARNPRMRIHLALLIPVRRPVRNGFVSSLNERIGALAERLDSPDSPVLLVDQNQGYDTHRHSYDGLHPNGQGERLLAERWFAGLEPLLAAYRPCSL